jgi:putative MATE family efflux protein
MGLAYRALRWLGLGRGAPRDLDEQVRRRVMKLAWPAVLQGLLMTSIQLVDTFLVSRISDDALAAVGTASQLIFVMMVLLIAVEIGASVLVAQAVGAGDRHQAGVVARQSITLGLLLSVPIVAAGYGLRRQLIGLFGLEPEVETLALEYWSVIAVGLGLVMVMFVLIGILQGSGDTKTPMLGTAIATVLNTFFAYVLIFGKLGFPELGVAGSAWGSIIGWSGQIVFMLAMTARGERPFTLFSRRGWRPSLNTARRIAIVGGPTAGEDLSISLGFALHTGIIATLGTAALAAHRIVFNALYLSFMPGFGLTIAATALVGQAVGARDPATGRRATSIAAQYSALWMGAMGVVYFVAARPIVDLFTSDPEVLGVGIDAMRALALSQAIWGLMFVYSGAMRGTGKSVYPAVANSIMIWAAVGLSFLVVEIGYGLAASWLMFAVVAPWPVLLLWRRLRREPLLDVNRPDARNWALLTEPPAAMAEEEQEEAAIDLELEPAIRR